ncbi:hypothetical protein [Acetobacterium tundrae]|uniref:Uncharacterized protein n=1 Tax=Acetobacterium tundrae TaxID=132932 RepID=A0ABR6WPY0_9FIRM|nr:hypothetical protein [Acetobacterium tundrae]MBC3798472.1 hypothetical protein [Acetobacterium tundrae]
MDVQNLLSKLTGKKEAYKTMEAKTGFFNFSQKASIGLALEIIDEVIEELEEVSGIKAPAKPEHRKVVHIDNQRMVR